MLRVADISKSYGTREILAGISFGFEKGQKSALVGPNGSGKTTLLKVLAGIEQPDSGLVEVKKGACVGYLPQDTSLAVDKPIGQHLREVVGLDSLEKELALLQADLTDPKKKARYEEVVAIYEKLGGYTFDHRIEVMLSGFGLDALGPERSLTELSSGQKSKVMLIGILLKGVDLLLLDEPTNNLDLPALIWLEDFISRSDVAVIVVSHDRKFLDKVVDRVMELDPATHSVSITGGTYSDFLLRKAKERERLKLAFRLQQEEIGRLMEQIRAKRMAAERGARFQGTDKDKFLRGFKRDRAAKSARSAKAMEKRLERMERVEKPIEKPPLEIPLSAQEHHASCEITLSKVVAGYPKFRIGPISLRIDYGSRVGIMGLNGSGKSTLLKVIAGHLRPVDGEMNLGSGVIIGDMMQEHESLPRDQTLFDFLASRTDLDLEEYEIYSVLVKFGLDRDQVKSEIGTLSPGGRARLLLALFALLSVNTLLLDEPTNHLDIEALEALEEMLQGYTGTVVLVSHDRYFIEKVGLNTAYLMVDGKLSKLPDYREYIKAAEQKARKLLRLL